MEAMEREDFDSRGHLFVLKMNGLGATTLYADIMSIVASASVHGRTRKEIGPFPGGFV